MKKHFFAKRGNFTKQFNKWKEGETILGEIFKQDVSKKRFSSNFSFFW